MYFAFVYLHLCYGIEIYGNTYHSYLNRLIILNNKIPYSEYYRMNPIAHMLQNFMKNITPFQFQNSIHNYRILSLVHKFTYHNSKLPIVFSTYFNDNQLFYEYIKYKGCKLWNNLPLDLKSITSNKLFNNKLKIFLRSSSD